VKYLKKIGLYKKAHIPRTWSCAPYAGKPYAYWNIPLRRYTPSAGTLYTFTVSASAGVRCDEKYVGFTAL